MKHALPWKSQLPPPAARPQQADTVGRAMKLPGNKEGSPAPFLQMTRFRRTQSLHALMESKPNSISVDQAGNRHCDRKMPDRISTTVR
jgi:hypothetical protein